MNRQSEFYNQLVDLLGAVYDHHIIQDLGDRIIARVSSSAAQSKPRKPWDCSDIMLITYGDAITSPNRTALHTLNTFLKARLKGLVSTVHILPFYPYTSDDGFAVADYRLVDPALGDWSDIETLSTDFELMFDLPINHASSEHPFFKEFLENQAPGNQYFLTAPIDTDVSSVTRPRTSDLLQTFETVDGPRHVWCTFSRDQVDWDFSNPDVLCEFIDIIAGYIERGATWLRLDAIAYLWKTLGTNCIHLPQTHALVKVLRLVTSHLNPQTTILTETNVPNEENLSYFGRGDEAHVVYNFSLPPLLLHSLVTGQGEWLYRWCDSLPTLPKGCTYLNFTASHDGIGMRPAEGLIPDEELDKLFKAMSAFGGVLNYRSRSDGSSTPYEVNIGLFDALKGTVEGLDDWQDQRFICAHAVMLALAGIPAIYYNSILSTPNFYAGVQRTGHNRTINRRKWSLNEVNQRLDDPSSGAHSVFNALTRLLSVRKQTRAFDPEAAQHCVFVDPRLFVVKRTNTAIGSQVLCVFNLSKQTVGVDVTQLGLANTARLSDLLSREVGPVTGSKLSFLPYQVSWFTVQ